MYAFISFVPGTVVLNPGSLQDICRNPGNQTVQLQDMDKVEERDGCDDVDIHICGSCRQQFNHYLNFTNHKRTCQQRKIKQNRKECIAQEDTEMNNDNYNVSNEIIENDEANESRPESQSSHNIDIREVEYQEKNNIIIPQKDVSNSKDNSKNFVQAVDDIEPKIVEASEALNVNVKEINNELKTKICTFQDCNFKARFNKDLVRHSRIHTGDKPWSCNICSKSFARKDKLNRHTKIHTGEKRFNCDLCEYKTYEKSHFIKHIRVHTDERPFSCKDCQYRCKSSSQLKSHIRIHTGETPYACKQQNCSAKFKTSSDLSRHHKIHTGEKCFKCDICEHRTNLRANLKSHMKVHLT